MYRVGQAKTILLILILNLIWPIKNGTRKDVLIPKLDQFANHNKMAAQQFQTTQAIKQNKKH